MSNVNPEVYVDLNALEGWRTQLLDANSSAVECLDSFDTTVKNLEDIWAGAAADGFYSSVADMVKDARRCHEQMSDTNNLLRDVANVLENQ